MPRCRARVHTALDGIHSIHSLGLTAEALRRATASRVICAAQCNALHANDAVEICAPPQQCAVQLTVLVDDPKRDWVGQPQSADGYADGTRLFAYRALRKKLTCGELKLSMIRRQRQPCCSQFAMKKCARLDGHGVPRAKSGTRQAVRISPTSIASAGT